MFSIVVSWYRGFNEKGRERERKKKNGDVLEYANPICYHARQAKVQVFNRDGRDKALRFDGALGASKHFYWFASDDSCYLELNFFSLPFPSLPSPPPPSLLTLDSNSSVRDARNISPKPLNRCLSSVLNEIICQMKHFKYITKKGKTK